MYDKNQTSPISWKYSPDFTPQTTPTPPDADAREVIAKACNVASDGVGYGEYQADRIIAALHAAGYAISRPARGMVMISTTSARRSAAWSTWIPGLSWSGLDTDALNELETAIAAADPQEP
jgi:hypothetical protein